MMSFASIFVIQGTGEDEEGVYLMPGEALELIERLREMEPVIREWVAE